MATLKIQFHCLCLFVRDNRNASAPVVHVVMPDTRGHGHDHVVRLVHPSLKENPGGLIKLEDWAWELSGTGHAVLESLNKKAGEPEIVHLTEMTGHHHDQGYRAKPDHVDHGGGNGVVSRVTLRSGRGGNRAADATWCFGPDDVRMAYMVEWEIKGVADKLVWHRLRGRGTPPFEKLTDLGPGEKQGKEVIYRMQLFHTMEPISIEPGTLDPEKVEAHFRHFYGLLGLKQPVSGELPKWCNKGIQQVNCGAAQSDLG